MPWMETSAGHVELLIGLDHKQWLPVHVEDSWDPDDDMRLMKSVFGRRYMITDGWGRDLLPPDNAPDGQAGAQGGGDDQEEAAQEVQLPEYRGWSQGAGRPGNDDGSRIATQRGGCLGARPKTRGAPPSQLVPSTRGRASQGGRQKEPNQEPRQPARTQTRFGTARPQASGRAQSGRRMMPPPRRRPSPSPPPAPGRRSWDWVRPAQRGQGQRGAGRGRPPGRPPSPGPGRAQGPLQLIGPGDNPMQKLALMMAVMILGMSPAHGCSIGADSRSPEVGSPAEMMPLLPTWFSSGGKTLMAKDTISSATAGGNRSVEPGGRLVGQIWPQTQWKVEGMERMGDEVSRVEKAPGEREEGPGPRGKNQVYKLEGEAAPKAAETLRRGADAARGRGQRKGRLYQRTGARN
jgi:hypothetical protein